MKQHLTGNIRYRVTWCFGKVIVEVEWAWPNENMRSWRDATVFDMQALGVKFMVQPR